MSSVGNEIKKLGLMSMYHFLETDPEKHLPELLDWLDTYMSPDVLTEQRKVFRKIIEDKDNNWYQLLTSLWTDIDDEVRKTLFENLIINANALAASKAKENRFRFDCNIPWSIAIDLDNGKDSLGFDLWDDVIEQAKKLGTFAFLFRGGEPLESKMEIIALCNKHQDCEFTVITDGEGIDEDFCRQILRVKNLFVTLKVKDTVMDERLSGKTDLMRRMKIPYAVSCLYSGENQDRFDTDEFFRDLVRHGVRLAFLISCLPDEADRVYRRSVEVRQTMPIKTVHFCKDRKLIGGCVAGGRYFCQIAANGDVEPCFFVNSSDRNICTSSLLEAYRGPCFMKYHGETAPPCPAVK